MEARKNKTARLAHCCFIASLILLNACGDGSSDGEAVAQNNTAPTPGAGSNPTPPTTPPSMPPNSNPGTPPMGNNTMPNANAGNDQSGITAGQLVTLDGSASTDSENDTLSFQWTQSSGPSVSLNNADSSQASFIAPTLSADENLVFSLRVNDGALSSSPASVTINILKQVATGPSGCGNQSSSAVAIDFTGPSRYNIVQNRIKYLTLAAYSDDISVEFHDVDDNPIRWSRRYKDFGVGNGGAAINSWMLGTAPSRGQLYEDSTLLSNGSIINDPDRLIYLPDADYLGSDTFSYCVSDSQGQSNIADVDLMVYSANSYSDITALGIPDPDFGIADSAPPDPPEWPNTEAPGFYYLDVNNPNCTDNNEFGTPNIPRCTFANNTTVSAGGKIVFQAGNYNTRGGVNHHTIRLEGEEGNRAWMVGVIDDIDRPIIHGNDQHDRPQLRIRGSHFTIEGFVFERLALNNTTPDGTASDKISFRHNSVEGNPSAGGGGTTLGLSHSGSQDYLVFDNRFFRNGVVAEDLSAEHDIHSMTLRATNRSWILENLCAYSAGDCIQVNAADAQNTYIGHLKSHSEGENCLDVKSFNNLLASENDCWDLRRVAYGNSGGNAQNFYLNDEGTQQGNFWLINNRSWDTGGFGIASRNIVNNGVQANFYAMGNWIWHAATCLGLQGGGGPKYAYLNTCAQSDNGLIIFSNGNEYAAGNFIDLVNNNGVPHKEASGGSIEFFDENAFADSPVIGEYGGNSSPNQAASLSEFCAATNHECLAQGGINSDAENSNEFSFSIGANSELIDQVSPVAKMHILDAISVFENQFGVSYTDRDGDLRITGNNIIDIGADEFVEN